MSAQNINANQFKKKVLESEKAVLVDFWAPWCMPCRMMAPILDELSEDPELKDILEVMKIDTDVPENQPLAMEYDVRGIPNMKLFKDGEYIQEFVGLRSGDILKQEILENLE